MGWSRSVSPIGAEDTFMVDILELEPARAQLRPLVAKVWRHCEAKGLHGRTVTLKVKFSDFNQLTRSRTLVHPPENAAEVEAICDALLDQIYPFRKGVRLLGVTLSALEQKQHG